MLELSIAAIVVLFVLYVVINLRKNSSNLNSLKQCTKCGTLQKTKCIQTRKSKIRLKERIDHQKFQIVKPYKCSKCSSTFEISSLVLLGSDLDSSHDDSFNHNDHTHYHESDFFHDGGFDGGHD